MKWLCLNCQQDNGVVNGMCRRCGPTKTKPQDDEAKLEADVAGAAKTAVADKEAEKEAAERDAASKAAAEGTTVNPSDL